MNYFKAYFNTKGNKKPSKKTTYKNHNSSIVNMSASKLSILMYVPAYLLLFISWYVSIPQIISYIVSLLPLIILIKEESPLVRFHAANSVAINVGLVLFINCFYLMLLGYQVHNTDWGNLIYAFVNYIVLVLIYVLPAYSAIAAKNNTTVTLPIIYKAVCKISKFEDYNKNLAMKGRR